MTRLLFPLLLLPAALAQDFVWAPKPAPAPYAGPHRVHTKLADLKARHAGQAEWQEVIVDDDLLHSVYLQRQPGSKSKPAFHPDTRTWWIVVEGQVRFNMEGSAPLVAGRMAVVQAPMQTVFQYEVVGDQPALIFETNIARAATVYLDPADIPEARKADYVKSRLPHKPGPYLHANQPLTKFEDVAAALEAGQVRGTQKIVEDDRAAGNFIYGREGNLPKINLADRGHFHTDSPEFWLIMAGQIRYRVEGFEVFIANPGDIVYVTRNRWHLARWHGDQPSCRFAMNGFPNLAHFYDPEISTPSNVPVKK